MNNKTVASVLEKGEWVVYYDETDEYWYCSNGSYDFTFSNEEQADFLHHILTTYDSDQEWKRKNEENRKCGDCGDCGEMLTEENIDPYCLHCNSATLARGNKALKNMSDKIVSLKQKLVDCDEWKRKAVKMLREADCPDEDCTGLGNKLERWDCDWCKKRDQLIKEANDV